MIGLLGFVIPLASGPEGRPDLGRRKSSLFARTARRNDRINRVGNSVEYGSGTMMGNLLFSR